MEDTGEFHKNEVSAQEQEILRAREEIEAYLKNPDREQKFCRFVHQQIGGLSVDTALITHSKATIQDEQIKSKLEQKISDSQIVIVEANPDEDIWKNASGDSQSGYLFSRVMMIAAERNRIAVVTDPYSVDMEMLLQTSGAFTAISEVGLAATAVYAFGKAGLESIGVQTSKKNYDRRKFVENWLKIGAGAATGMIGARELGNSLARDSYGDMLLKQLPFYSERETEADRLGPEESILMSMHLYRNMMMGYRLWEIGQAMKDTPLCAVQVIGMAHVGSLLFAEHPEKVIENYKNPLFKPIIDQFESRSAGKTRSFKYEDEKWVRLKRN